MSNFQMLLVLINFCLLLLLVPVLLPIAIRNILKPWEKEEIDLSKVDTVKLEYEISKRYGR